MEKQLLKFLALLNTEPKKEELGKTPDGKASTLPISFIENQLDEIFLGQWETHTFTYQVAFNEVIGSIILEVTHPATGVKYKRVGAGAVSITQDAGTKVSDFLNAKKLNGLDLSFPKLKAECLKNAAQSLGKLFGRDLNRKLVDVFDKKTLSVALDKKTTLSEAQMDNIKKAISNNQIESVMTMLKIYDIVDNQIVIINDLIQDATTKQIQ